MKHQCSNCFASIPDMRSATRCDTCNKSLHKDCAIVDGGTFCDVCYLVKQEEGNKEMAFEVPEVIRRSYIETYRTCPYKFYLEVIKGNDSGKTIYTQLGIDLHDLFDRACNDKEFTESMMKYEFISIWDKYEKELFDNEEVEEKMYQRGIECITAFYKLLPTLQTKPFVTEETIQFSIGENLPLVQITMDRIDEVDGELEIMDWKTGKTMTGMKLSTDLQPPLYIKAVIERFKKPVRKFRLFYLQEEKEREYVRNPSNPEEYICTVKKREYKINLTDAVREVQHLFSQIIKGNFNIPRDTKKLYFSCKMCAQLKNRKCQGAEQESWYQNKTREW